jgi:hypothetical protein
LAISEGDGLEMMKSQVNETLPAKKSSLKTLLMQKLSLIFS